MNTVLESRTTTLEKLMHVLAVQIRMSAPAVRQSKRIQVSTRVKHNENILRIIVVDTFVPLSSH